MRVLVSKILVFSLVMFCLQQDLEAQSKANVLNENQLALIERLDLSEAQQIRFAEIEVQKNTQLAEITSLKSRDKSTYLAKRRAIYEGAEGSLLLLIQPHQKKAWDAEVLRRRQEIAKTVHMLRENGAPPEKILDARSGIPTKE